MAIEVIDREHQSREVNPRPPAGAADLLLTHENLLFSTPRQLLVESGFTPGKQPNKFSDYVGWLINNHALARDPLADHAPS